MERQIVSKEIFGNRFSEVLNASAETTYTIAERLSLTPGTISRYANGLMAPKIPTLYMLADIFNVNPIWLMGYDAPKFNNNAGAALPSNLVSLPKMEKVPLIGEIACGTPILAEQNIKDYVDLPGHIRADYALECKGDSMINAGIRNGDIVYIRQQPEVENGEIAAVAVDEDEATLKRFYHDGDVVQLVAENPRIAPKVFTGEDINRVRVIGLAVAYTHVIE